MVHRLRNLVLRAVIAGLAVAVGLFAVEMTFQLIEPPLPPHYRPQQIYVSHFRASDILPFELRQSYRGRFSMEDFDTTVVTNSVGMRSPEVDFSRKRILVMGDSLTFGMGVENADLYTVALEERFERKVQIVNGGFAGGYSPDMYALWLRERARAVRPDAIVVTIYENDYLDVSIDRWTRHGAEMAADDPGEPDAIESPGNVVTADGAWMRNSRLARWPAWARRMLKRSYLVGLARDRLIHDAATPSDPASDEENAQVLADDKKFARSLELLWKASDGHLAAIYRVYGADSHGAKTRPAPTRMDRLIAAFAAEHNVPVLSNYEDFDPKTDFFPLNKHWTPSGHRRVADYLYTELKKLGY